MAFDLRDRFETRDGSRPELTPLALEHGQQHALVAFAVLAGGDVLDATTAPPADGAQRARSLVEARVELGAHGAPAAQRTRVVDDVVHQLQGNPVLVDRLWLAKPLLIELVPIKKNMAALGYPTGVSPQTAGLFWNRPDWQRARIALRQDLLDQEPALVFHELAHAIHYLAFTRDEQQLIYRVLQPAFGSRSAMDEVFAIYSERELAGAFVERDKRAPGVYGFTRQQWNENHLFTRFVRKLYFPYRAAAGPAMAPRRGGDWMKGIAQR
ncbi:MAG: hypothetical protein JXR83_11895 [Deltaproteobacteria bacterium]|nr:hypothetical protein [Deltaproteobacteria bacterium]